MNMTITYHYKNLGELAAFYENKALELRDQAKGLSIKTRKFQDRVIEASAYESVAYVLRNSILEV